MPDRTHLFVELVLLGVGLLAHVLAAVAEDVGQAGQRLFLPASDLGGVDPEHLRDHLNEGHSGFVVLEAIRSRMEEEGIDFHQAVPRVSREVVFTTHTPVPAGHDRFDGGLIEEHLGPLRDGLGLSHDSLMGLGRENPGNTQESFCVTVLGLRVARRANAVSALHGEVSRAMWTGLFPGKTEDTVPIGHITNGVHVPTWLAPQMFRLYDRHFGTGWHQHNGEAHIWESIENVDDGELWETHLSLKARLLEFVRRSAVEQAERRGESPEIRRRLSRILSPDVLTHRFRPALRHLQKSQPDTRGHGNAGLHGE